MEDPDNPWEIVWDALDSTDTIKYSDSYFDAPSPGDHPELRAVSCALGLAGFENEADSYPSDSSTPNPKLQLFLEQLGFSNFQKMRYRIRWGWTLYGDNYCTKDSTEWTNVNRCCS